MTKATFRKLQRTLAIVTVCVGVAMLTGCATRAAGPPAFSATASANYAIDQNGGLTRSEALRTAERAARHDILNQALQLSLSNGQGLDELAVVDPYVRAVVADNVRTAPIRERDYDDDAGVVAVTIVMELAPIHELIERYPRHALQ